MATQVLPKVHLIGWTDVNVPALTTYLEETGQEDFLVSWRQAMSSGLTPGEALCSFYAKLCYKSLVLGTNDNVSRVRDIQDNIRAAFDAGHGSVFEHCVLNFVVTNCSRVFTHELVRHRAGTAFSQTSGRYCRGSDINVILDPITASINDQMIAFAHDLEFRYENWCNAMGLNGLNGIMLATGLPDTPDSRQRAEAHAQTLGMRMNSNGGWEHTFAKKKAITSALRRMLPNGQANEIGFSVNIRSLRHMVQVRTSEHAEWEIRYVFDQIYRIVDDKFPMLWHGARTRLVDGLLVIENMKMQPYDVLVSQ